MEYVLAGFYLVVLIIVTGYLTYRIGRKSRTERYLDAPMIKGEDWPPPPKPRLCGEAMNDLMQSDLAEGFHLPSDKHAYDKGSMTMDEARKIVHDALGPPTYVHMPDGTEPDTEADDAVKALLYERGHKHGYHGHPQAEESNEAYLRGYAQGMDEARVHNMADAIDRVKARAYTDEDKNE